jgi:uncharacterized membrane protein YsdA (DUF1294 family)
MLPFLEFLVLLMQQYWWALLGILIVWNAFVYSMYADDKRRSLEGEWRHREADLLGVAFMGGSIGAIAACLVTRHKTRKKSFADQLFYIALIQMLLFGGLIGLGFWYPT